MVYPKLRRDQLFIAPPAKGRYTVIHLKAGDHMQQDIIFRPIGAVRSPFTEPTGTPIQSSAAGDTAGIVEILPEYREGLQDIEGFSHLILLTYFHLTQGLSLKVTPFLDDHKRGLFATLAPARPNPIGLSIVRLERVEGTRLHIRDVDIVEGTPVLDIKPYVPKFDMRQDATSGWFTENLDLLECTRDDGRFLP